MKKITGDKADEHYKRSICDSNTGELIKTIQLQPEYVTMSRNPAIAKEYFEQFGTDLFPNDRIVLQRQGHSYYQKPPRYFLKKMEEINPELINQVKTKRRIKQKRNKKDNTPERQLVKEAVKKAQTINLNRHFEENHYES